MVTLNDIKQTINCKPSFLLTHWRIGFPKIPSDKSLVDYKKIVLHQMNTTERGGDCLMLQLGKYNVGLNKLNLDRILKHSFIKNAK